MAIPLKHFISVIEPALKKISPDVEVVVHYPTEGLGVVRNKEFWHLISRYEIDDNSEAGLVAIAMAKFERMVEIQNTLPR